MRLTDAQRRAVEFRGGSLLVGAAAGSGKTTVLAARVLSLLTDRVSPVRGDRLAAVTFTNAAAEELRARIELGLEQYLQQNPGDRTALRQQNLVRRAAIGTIHSFCAEVAREFSHLLDIPPDFMIADEFSSAELSFAAMEQATGSLYSRPESGFASLVELYGRSRSDGEAAGLMLQLADFFENLVDPDAWVQRVLSGEFSGERAVSELCAGAAGRAAGLLRAAAEECAGDPVLESAYLPAIESDLVQAEQLSRAAREGDAAGMRQLALGLDFRRLGSAGRASPEPREAARLLRDAAKKQLSELRDFLRFLTPQDLESDRQESGRIFRAALEAYREYSDALSKLKARGKLLSFSDLERCALRVLRDPKAGEELRQRFDQVLVDEFQDVNPVQSEIFRLLTEGRGNLFAVGDVKQSIYQFRRADPSIFTGLRRRAQEGGELAFLSLEQNFRSSVAAIDGVNAVFYRLMTPELGGVDYTAEALQPGEGAAAGEAPGVELRVVLGSGVEQQAAAAADYIRRMLEQGAPVEDRSGARPCRPEDFCIMFRSSGNRQAFENALLQAGLRVSSGGEGGFFESSEVAVMLNLLKLVLNGTLDLEAASVMLSPLFGFTPDQLAELREKDRRTPLLALAAGSSRPELREFAGRIGRYRAASSRLSVPELLQLIYEDSSAELLLTAGPEMQARQRNLRLLLQSAGERAAAGDDLRQFLRLCQRAAERGRGMAGRQSHPAGAVALTTVHSAKGLEWPFVLFCETNRLFNRGDDSSRPVVLEEQGGFGARLRRTGSSGLPVVHRTAEYQSILGLIRERSRSEEMRVLYVALTRAKQRAVAFCSVKGEKELEKRMALWQAMADHPELAAGASCFADWIGAGCCTPMGRLHCTITQLQPPGEPPAPREAPLPRPEPELAAELRRRAEFQSPLADLSTVPAKASVTSLVKGSGGQLMLPSFSRGGRLAGAQRGTAVHLFMECADYAAAARDPEGELRRLLEEGYLDEATAGAVDIEKLRAFFSSSLARRMLEHPVLREYEFILPVDPQLLGAPGHPEERVLVQGIADCVILESDGAVIVDYKTDLVKTPRQLAERYRPQLQLYRQAVEPRLGLPVKQLLIWSFCLGEEIEL